jgi:hypothetical protein
MPYFWRFYGFDPLGEEMKTKASLLLIMLLCVSACGSSRPLVYEEMTETERTAETNLQDNLNNTAATIADLAFKFVDEDKRANIAESVVKALKIVQGVLESGDNEQLVKGLIDQTIGDLELLGTDIDEVAKDAFDLLNGWINLPNITEYLPEVVRDRLLAFVNGAISGLEEYVGS